MERCSRKDDWVANASLGAQDVHKSDGMIDVRTRVAILAPLHAVLLRSELNGRDHQADVIEALHLHPLTWAIAPRLKGRGRPSAAFGRPCILRVYRWSAPLAPSCLERSYQRFGLLHIRANTSQMGPCCEYGGVVGTRKRHCGRCKS